jgi:hypothetical protein
VVPYPEKFYRLLEGSLKALNSPVCNWLSAFFFLF